ncbi:MAG: SDR family oxidoreductase [Alphaproteobacteria bacterium]|jgi:NAD(P)-dependent dehydrogenase (short-subunit alcohol dehydrogenase family)|nr:SDR family oxidoreductase [Alphaproteobacteria bacterium]
MAFNNETVLITGTASGIGHAAVRRFAAEGCRVIATVEREDQIDAMAAMDGVALATKLDVRLPEDWAGVVEAAGAKLGGVDILFNNAGVTVWGGLEETDMELWNRMIAINLTGQFLGCKTVVPGMLAKGKGAIVNMASVNGIRGNTKLIGYSAAKGGIVAMTRSLALDYATKGIRVNCICPGTIDTPMAQTSIDIAEDKQAAIDALNAKHPMGRLGTAEEVASVAVFLAGSDSGYVTGQAIPVDGGRSVR